MVVVSGPQSYAVFIKQISRYQTLHTSDLFDDGKGERLSSRTGSDTHLRVSIEGEMGDIVSLS